MGFKIGKVFKSAAKIASAPFVEPFRAVKKASEGDYYGALNSAVKVGSFGTLGLPSTKMPDSGGDVNTDDATDKLEIAKEESIKRRRALYATKGGALGAEVDSVGGTFGNNRGSLFGN